MIYSGQRHSGCRYLWKENFFVEDTSKGTYSVGKTSVWKLPIAFLGTLEDLAYILDGSSKY